VRGLGFDESVVILGLVPVRVLLRSSVRRHSMSEDADTRSVTMATVVIVSIASNWELVTTSAPYTTVARPLEDSHNRWTTIRGSRNQRQVL
jgi:hypothetical protein